MMKGRGVGKMKRTTAKEEREKEGEMPSAHLSMVMLLCAEISDVLVLCSVAHAHVGL